MTTTTHTIRCGRCKSTHETTEQVRTCYNTTTEAPPTEKQVAFITRLAGERPSFKFSGPWTKRDASNLIDQLLAQPKEVDHQAGGENTLIALLLNVPDGYYALPSKTGTNDLDFIVVVTRNTKRYVNRYLGGQGPVLITSAEQRAFAQQLSGKAPDQLLALSAVFGIQVGRCGRCGRSLTDQISRARGFGSDCWSKL
jgi:uncharacterized protein DUF6011